MKKRITSVIMSAAVLAGSIGGIPMNAAANPYKAKQYPLVVNSGRISALNDINYITTSYDDDGKESYKIAADKWVNVDAILDTQNGKEYVSVAGSDYEVFDVSDWLLDSPATLPINYVSIAGSNDATPMTADIRDIRITTDYVRRQGANETWWTFAEYTGDAAVSASGAQTVEYNGLNIHLNSGDSVTDSGVMWTSPGTTTSNSTKVSNNRYIEFAPQKSGTITVEFSGSKYASTSKAARMYIVTGDMSKTNGDAEKMSATATAANRTTILTANLEKGKTYYIWPYYYSDSSCQFTVSRIEYVADTTAPEETDTPEPTATHEPTEEPTAAPTEIPAYDAAWTFAEADTSGETTVTCAPDYKKTEGNYGILEVHLGSGDTLTNGGLYWAKPSIIKSNTAITNNRYIKYTAAANSTMDITFTASGATNRNPRLYAFVCDDLIDVKKDSGTTNTNKQVSAVDTDTVFTINMEKGKTYYICSFYNNTESCTYTIKNITLTAMLPEMRTRNIYESNMLLQRDKDIYIDGLCNAAVEEPTITLTNATTNAVVETKEISVGDTTDPTSATVDSAMKYWHVTLAPVSDYTSTYTLTISCGGMEDIVYTNILFGDRYIFSGQSNMWKQVSYYKNIDRNYYGESAAGEHLTDKIRVMYTPGQSDYGTNVLQFNAQGKKAWRDFSTYANVQDVAAPAFTAACELYEETGVPIGVIDNPYPGSYISSWFDSALAIDACNTGRNKTSNERNWYCGRIYPLRHLALSGIFWYQGEADAATTYHDDPYTYYSEMLPRLIDTYRELFGDSSLPFCFTQLSRIGSTVVDDEYGADAGATGKMPIKLAQTDTYLSYLAKGDTNIGIVSTLDLYGAYTANSTANCRGDIHLGQKQYVGDRMAKFALKTIYGKDAYSKDMQGANALYSAGDTIYKMGPMYKSAVSENGRITVTFDCSGDLVIMPAAQYSDSQTAAAIESGGIDASVLNEFQIAGEDKVWYAAEAEISGNTVILTSDSVAAPMYVRYCGSDYPESPNLTDASGLPAYVFSKTAAAAEPQNPLQAAVDGGTSDKTVTISGSVNGGGAKAAVPADAVVNVEGTITRGTLEAESGSFTVVIGSSRIENVSSIGFDSDGKISAVSDSAAMTTSNNDGTYDKGTFIIKNASPGERVSFTIRSGGKSTEKTAQYDGNYDGSVLFGIFITDIPDGTDVTVE